MVTFSTSGGFTTKDMLQCGFAHSAAACDLFSRSPTFYDSAGYLAHLGIEIILKAWHLHCFGEFSNTHKLATLYGQLRELDRSIQFSPQLEAFIKKLDKYYFLRYPRRFEGPIEVGSVDKESVESLLAAIWNLFPEILRTEYNSLDATEKSGRKLMKKKVLT